MSEARIERENGPVRRAYLPAETEPVYYGTHGPVAWHDGTASGQFPEHAPAWALSSALPPVD